jgi:hypothetical protein
LPAERLVSWVGVLLIAAALGGPAAWPWYLSWGLVLLAACPGPQRSRALAAVAAASVFLVKPDGILALPLATAPGILALYALAAATAWYVHRRRPGQPRPAGAEEPPDRGGQTPAPALVES